MPDEPAAPHRPSIPHRSFTYEFFGTWVRLAVYFFFRRIEIRYHEPLPTSGPLLFTPNHSNALSDALVPAVTPPQQITFLARADVFRKPLLRKFFHSIKMLPIFRTRDGAEKLAFNEMTFDLCAGILGRGDAVLIFPEGNHSMRRRLRPLKKGAARIALQAEQSFEDRGEAGVRIVPVGLSYDHPTRFDAELLIQYGPHIDVSEYRKRYRKNAKAAVNELRRDLEERLRKIVLHIEEDAVHDAAVSLWEMQRSRLRREALRDYSAEFAANQSLVRRLEQEYRERPKRTTEFCDRVREYVVRRNAWFIGEAALERRAGLPTLLLDGLALMLLAPVQLLGLVNFYPVAMSLRLLSRRLFRDVHFHGALKLVGGMFLIPVYWIAAAGAVAVLAGPFEAIVYAVTYPFSGIFARHYRRAFFGWIEGVRCCWLRNVRRSAWQSFDTLRQDLRRFL